MNRVRIVCYSLAIPVLWMCSSMLMLDVAVESSVCLHFLSLRETFKTAEEKNVHGLGF